jgi:hypothetical protein
MKIVAFVGKESVRPHDIVRGRGGFANHHEGNKRLRSGIQNLLLDYKKAKHGKKREIAQRAIDEVKESGGRFLEQVMDDRGKLIGYKEMDNETKIWLVQQKFRDENRPKDCAAEIATSDNLIRAHHATNGLADGLPEVHSHQGGYGSPNCTNPERIDSHAVAPTDLIAEVQAPDVTNGLTGLTIRIIPIGIRRYAIIPTYSQNIPYDESTNRPLISQHCNIGADGSTDLIVDVQEHLVTNGLVISLPDICTYQVGDVVTVHIAPKTDIHDYYIDTTIIRNLQSSKHPSFLSKHFKDHDGVIYLTVEVEWCPLPHFEVEESNHEAGDDTCSHNY